MTCCTQLLSRRYRVNFEYNSYIASPYSKSLLDTGLRRNIVVESFVYLRSKPGTDISSQRPNSLTAPDLESYNTESSIPVHAMVDNSDSSLVKSVSNGHNSE